MNLMSALSPAKHAKDWPLADEVLPSHLLTRLAYYARLAPSTHNTQPWKFVISGREIDVLADKGRWMRIADSLRRELHISMGCTIESLRIAADFAGCSTSVSYFPIPHNEELVARIVVGESGTERASAVPDLLPHAITRRTNHRKFDPAQPVKDSERRSIYTCFDNPVVAVHLITGRPALDRLADLEREADRELFADPAFRSELAAWIGEGSLGTSWLISKLGQFAVEALPLGRPLAQLDSGRVASAPLAILLSTPHDDPIEHVHVGEAYMRIALTAESLALRIQPVSQVLELPQTRQRVAEAAGLEDRFAQHLFRIGHAQAEPAIRRRRPLADIALRGDL